MDTHLSDLLCLERMRADVAVGALSASSIVIHFELLEYGLSHLASGGETFAVNGLDFEVAVHRS